MTREERNALYAKCVQGVNKISHRYDDYAGAAYDIGLTEMKRFFHQWLIGEGIGEYYIADPSSGKTEFRLKEDAIKRN